MTPFHHQVGFTLLPVIMAMTLIAAVAFLLNRSNALHASMIATRSDLDHARYAAEAGLQAVNYVVQQTGCVGGYPTSATPISDSNFGGAAYSAYASAALGSPLTLTATGTYKTARVTLTRANVHVYQTGVRNYIHQPNGVLGVDTFVDPANPDANYGLSSELAIGGSSFESLIKFDLSFFPAGSRIVPWYDTLSARLVPGAPLEIYKKTSGTSTPNPSFIEAQLIARSWIEGDGSSGATWNTYDGVKSWVVEGKRYDNRTLSVTPHAGASGWQSIDITDAARAWMGPVYANYGVWLRSSASGDPVPNSRYASSDETSNPSQRPRLNISYLLPCGATAPVPPVGVTLTLNPVADGYMSNAAQNDSYGTATNLAVFDNGGDLRRTLLRFDLSSIPTGQALQSASLRIYSSAMSNASNSQKTISAHVLLEPWAEGTTSAPGNGMSWRLRDGVLAWLPSAGGTYRATGSAMAADELTGTSPPPKGFTTGWLAWNVKGIAQEWVDGLTPNRGVILISTVRDNPTLVSREGSSSQRPQLVITY